MTTLEAVSLFPLVSNFLFILLAGYPLKLGRTDINEYFVLDGFFDAGMLLQALKARGEHIDDGETKPSERAAVQARRRVDVGKKLRLIDY